MSSAYTIQGNIFATDLLDRLSRAEIKGQTAKDFGLEQHTLREEIQLAYSIAKNQWQIFQQQLKRRKTSDTLTSETRNLWMLPFLQLLGYNLELARAEEIMGKSFAISHRDRDRDRFPVHLVGLNDDLDRKRPLGGTRLSPHGLMQEYLNLHAHLYGLVSNGRYLRLLRDSGKLVRLTYLEFDLQTMMEEEHLAEFGLLYRLLHPSRMPFTAETSEDCLLEFYHQESLESGARIRDGLSLSVRVSLEQLGQGFVDHPDNTILRQQLADGELTASAYYQQLLRLIYRLLFLLVIEERKLIYPKDADANKQQLYETYYSLTRLRRLSEKRYLADQQHSDLWIALRQTFRLFQAAKYGRPLAIPPLSGELFGSKALPALEQAQLANEVLLQVIRQLNQFHDADTGQLIRVNYGALNVEEFGSVYENLLELKPELTHRNGNPSFSFAKGEERAASGSHYTPDELVRPLIEHSLDHLIEERKGAQRGTPAADQETALLSLRVCDVACGSGHILLAAARRIGLAVAQVRTGEMQPGPGPLRQATRDAIRHCIYGVDKNPLAVELCKVALWLEAHQPGEPLSFLDHRIKCGDALVGLARPEELKRGIATEAFKKLPGDDKDVAAALRKTNKADRKSPDQLPLDTQVQPSLRDVARLFRKLEAMPDRTPAEVEAKAQRYRELQKGSFFRRVRHLADLQCAAFFLAKTEANRPHLITDADYRRLFRGRTLREVKDGLPITRSEELADQYRFFHWFLEFPEVFSRVQAGAAQTDLFGGTPAQQLSLDTQTKANDRQVDQLGFDVILGNPPFLGGYRLTGTFGYNYYEYLKTNYVPAGGQADLVAYFFRRVFELVKS